MKKTKKIKSVKAADRHMSKLMRDALGKPYEYPKKPSTKKATTGEKVVDWFCESVHEGNVFNDAPNDRENGRSGQSLARRIDSALTRRDTRAIEIVNNRLGADTQAAKDIISMIRSNP